MSMSEKIVTRTGLSNTETACWYLLVIGTCGMAYPLYRMRRHAANRKSTARIR
jgi:hypothetical protein